MNRNLVLSLVLFALIVGCSNEPPKSHPDLSILPPKENIPALGRVEYITPRQFLDLLNSPNRPTSYFLQDVGDNPTPIPPLPGMQIISLGEIYNLPGKLPKGSTVYLICLYGDDSKRFGQEMAKDGFNCYYLDGGIYNFNKQMQQNGWKLPSP